jgi:serine/threonine protein kinase/tetratricopeptide (TPR) repeat protein
MGVVYRAQDVVLGRAVAMKFLPAEFSSDRNAFERLQREARAASALDHPNICSIHEFGEHEGHPFIVMQLLDGQTLREWIKTPAADQTSHLQQSLALAIQIAKGLQAAHEKGVIHRDIKPANIFVTARGDVRILDFGLAKVLVDQLPIKLSPENQMATSTGPNPAATSVHLTRTGIAMGTAAYMSPEQVMGEKIDSRSDIFSFGLVLYEMATGQRAFPGDKFDQVREAILFSEPQPIRTLHPQLPAELERIVSKALIKDREKRYRSAADMIADLEELHLETESRKRSKGRYRWTQSVTGILIAALIAGGLYYHGGQKPKLAENDAVVLADFTNSTPDKIFDSTMKQALSVALNQSPLLEVVSDDRVARMLQNMERPLDTVLEPQVAREVCQRANVRSYISGSIRAVGNEYLFGLKALNCRSGDVLAQEQFTASSKENALNALDSVAKKLGANLGEKLASMPKLDLPLENAATTSLHALEAFSIGRATLREKGASAAQPYFLRAVELDPNFAVAYWNLANTYTVLGDSTRATESYMKAFQLREHASPWDTMGITGIYCENVTGELHKAAQSFQNVIANYPRLGWAHSEVGVVYMSQGLYAQAADEIREGMRLSKEDNSTNLANALLALQRFDETQQVLRGAPARTLDDYLAHLQLYALAFLRPDPQDMVEQEQWFSHHPEVEHNGLAFASDTEAYMGHLRRSRELTRQSVASSIRADSKESGAVWQENAALREAAFGNAKEARQLVAEGLKLSPENQGVQLEAALALAMIGDRSHTALLTKELEKRYPLDTQVHALWISPIQAQLELDRNNPSAALASLPNIGALEYGQISFLNSLSCLYPAYIHGNAYLAAGQGAQAAIEFQKILDHCGMVWNCWTGVLAHLGLARAYALESRSIQVTNATAASVRARAAYKDFLTLWKDADPDIPILRQAKQENTRLQ